MNYINSLIGYRYSIKKITKRSIMGHDFDKTWDYYRGNLAPSPLDDSFIIEFCHKDKNFIIECDPEEYQEAIDYASQLEYNTNVDNILVAFEANGDTYNDITLVVHKFYGPENNFYSNKNFKVRRKHISNHPLYIIDKSFHIHSFLDEDDIVDIFSDGRKII